MIYVKVSEGYRVIKSSSSRKRYVGDVISEDDMVDHIREYL